MFVSQLAYLDFSSSNFNVQGHIVSPTMWAKFFVHECAWNNTNVAWFWCKKGRVISLLDVGWAVCITPFALTLLSVVHPPNVWGSCVNNVLFMDHSSVVALYFGGSLTPSTTLVDFSSRSESMGHATLENFSFLVTTSWPYQYFYFYFCIFSILWCSGSGDHPWDDLAIFGNSNIWK
jgi:hypothetical protein